MNIKDYYLLREMPYYETPEGDIYDIEMELYVSDLEGFRNKLLSILKGEKLTDKRGNSIQLTTEPHIQEFLNWLSSDSQILLFLKMRHKISDPISFINDLVENV
jgi:hypothetical protein